MSENCSYSLSSRILRVVPSSFPSFLGTMFLLSSIDAPLDSARATNPGMSFSVSARIGDLMLTGMPMDEQERIEVSVLWKDPRTFVMASCFSGHGSTR